MLTIAWQQATDTSSWSRRQLGLGWSLSLLARCLGAGAGISGSRGQQGAATVGRHWWY